MIQALLCSGALFAVAPRAAQRPATPPPEAGDAQAESDPQIVARWRELLELDLPAPVLREGPPLVTGTGRLRANGEAVALVARAMHAGGQESLAKNLLGNARPADPQGAAHVVLARAAIALDEDDLVRVLRDLAPKGPETARFPEHPETWLYVGRAYSRMGEPERADVFLTRFTSAAPLHSEAPAAWHMLAQHAIGRRDTEAANGLRDKAQAAGRWQAYYKARRLQIRERPEAPLPRLGLAQLWLEARRYDRAREVLEALIALAPDFARGWSHLGEARRLSGDTPGAREAFDRALELAPPEPLALFGRAAVAQAEGDTGEATARFEALVASHPEDPRSREALLMLARLASDSGDAAKADARYAEYRQRGGTEALDAGSSRPGGG